MGRLVTEKLISKGFIVKIFDLPSANYDGFDPKKTELIKGDLNNESDLMSGISDVDSVVHLAAILPPLANENEELAKKVNVDGTKKIVEVIQDYNPSIHFIFSSSVSIYGKNTDNKTITEISNPNPDDNYALTKFQSEEIVTSSSLNFTVLRISGVSIPIFQEPPTEWPFMSNQNIEFIHRDDVVDSICNSVGNENSYKQILNISGGKTWQMSGEKYVKDYFEILEVGMENANYQKEEGHFSWYDSDKSNKILNYQNKNYELYLSEIIQDLEKLMGE